MAKLIYESLTLEIKYVGLDTLDVHYEIAFLWDGEPMINDSILKRSSDYWNRRSKGTFLANEYEKDTLIGMIERILETNEPDYWEPYEPDIILAIYPEMFFPFLKSHYQLVYVRDDVKQKYEERKREKLKKGKLPNDPFTVIAFVDTYNFQNASAYSGNGIALNMVVERQDIETFCQKLKEEYAELKEKFKVDETAEDSEVFKSEDSLEREA